jgi:ATP-binding cassette, subfamily F, member 3
MIIVKNISKSIYQKILFEDVSFVLNRGDKVGLVGPNGAGKSTLLKIVLGVEEVDSGSVNIEKERISFLNQEIEFMENQNVLEFLEQTTPSNLSDLPPLRERRGISEILEEVGLENLSTETLVKNLSGGQKTKLGLAKILLEKPSCIFLDEPTNHLDEDGIIFLENFVKNFYGIVFIISHDRKFLDNSVNRIFEIDSANKEFHIYNGNYSFFKNEKKKRLENQDEDYRKQQKKLKEMNEWLALKRQEAKIFADPSKGKQIRAMEKRIQREIYDQEIKKPKDNKKIKNLELDGGVDNAKLILKVTDLTKSYGNKRLFYKASFEIRGTERLAVVGKNGTGKTTLIKILQNMVTGENGEVKFGNNIKAGYYSQEQDLLDMEKTIEDEYLSTERLDKYFDIENTLGTFLFHGDDIYKKVGDLSFGERVRLMFAKLTHQENDLLILDEPTNHLDIESREILENALNEYEGAILVVSHDRYFLEQIGIQKFLVLGNGKIETKFL